ncbi:MAG: diaminopimelate epimerase [Candidatus Obscuribacterales bacterium]|nr:diaminopimelate epimerase [Candidatus Obscuribacterales bacterium]
MTSPKSISTASTFINRDINFEKIQGLGNDFVLVTEVELAEALGEIPGLGGGIATKADLEKVLSRLALAVCHRRLGVGGDGLIVAVRRNVLENLSENLPGTLLSNSPDSSRNSQKILSLIGEIVAGYAAEKNGLDARLCPYSWIYINSDGTYASMCGNGLRCLSLFLIRKGFVCLTDNAVQFSVRCLDYPVHVTVEDLTAGGDSTELVATTRLAGPIFDQTMPEYLNIAGSAVPRLNDGVESSARIKFAYVDMGNPHCVVLPCREEGYLDWLGYLSDISPSLAGESNGEKVLNELSRQIQSNSLFPQGVNVEWVAIDGPQQARVYVVERGCGPTLACGSGACAVVAAGVKEMLLNRQCCVILPGGELQVSYLSGDGALQKSDALQEYIELTGPARLSFQGAFDLQAFLSANLADLGD